MASPVREVAVTPSAYAMFAGTGRHAVSTEVSARSHGPSMLTGIQGVDMVTPRACSMKVGIFDSMTMRKNRLDSESRLGTDFRCAEREFHSHGGYRFVVCFRRKPKGAENYPYMEAYVPASGFPWAHGSPNGNIAIVSWNAHQSPINRLVDIPRRLRLDLRSAARPLLDPHGVYPFFFPLQSA